MYRAYIVSWVIQSNFIRQSVIFCCCCCCCFVYFHRPCFMLDFHRLSSSSLPIIKVYVHCTTSVETVDEDNNGNSFGIYNGHTTIVLFIKVSWIIKHSLWTNICFEAKPSQAKPCQCIFSWICNGGGIFVWLCGYDEGEDNKVGCSATYEQ